MRLGLDTYSLRWQGWDAFQLLDYAARLGLDNVQFSERGALASLDPDYLRSLKRSADQHGLSIELGMLSFDQFSTFFRPEYGPGEQQLTDVIRAAPLVGSASVRCVLGGQAERLGPIPFEQHIEEFLHVLRAAAPVARDLGIKVAVENHGGVDFLARELRSLVESAGTDVVGVCLDTGNSAYAGEDPVVSTEILAPYVLTTQVRDTRVWSVPGGAMAQWVPLGQGSTDLHRIRDLLREHAPGVAFNLEIITGGKPRHIPYADPNSDFWRAYPNMLARDFARFVVLAQTGPAEPLAQVILPEGIGTPPAGPHGDALREQQRRHFEDSMLYAREELGFRPGTA